MTTPNRPAAQPAGEVAAPQTLNAQADGVPAVPELPNAAPQPDIDPVTP